jgi:hypothetical protein
MSYEVVSYVLIGGLFTAIMVPLIALLRKSMQEERRLKESKTAKKPKTPLEQPEELIAW